MKILYLFEKWKEDEPRVWDLSEAIPNERHFEDYFVSEDAPPGMGFWVWEGELYREVDSMSDETLEALGIPDREFDECFVGKYRRATAADILKTDLIEASAA